MIVNIFHNRRGDGAETPEPNDGIQSRFRKAYDRSKTLTAAPGRYPLPAFPATPSVPGVI